MRLTAISTTTDALVGSPSSAPGDQRRPDGEVQGDEDVLHEAGGAKMLWITLAAWSSPLIAIASPVVDPPGRRL